MELPGVPCTHSKFLLGGITTCTMSKKSCWTPTQPVLFSATLSGISLELLLLPSAVCFTNMLVITCLGFELFGVMTEK
jgi:hypothetical protein